MWGALLSEVLAMRELKRYFQPKVDKAAVAGSSRGHISAARTDPQHPWPAGQAAFSLPGAARFALQGFSTGKKNLKAFKVTASARMPHFYAFFIYISTQKFWFVRLFNMQSFWFYFCTWFLLCIVHWDVRSILKKIKISTEYALKWTKRQIVWIFFYLIWKYFVFSDSPSF